jgi:hypothetical protein|tara:strand:- start:1583 stop:1873 length:291 start_codon:yes stop_codon:yes gene_type:complete
MATVVTLVQVQIANNSTNSEQYIVEDSGSTVLVNREHIIGVADYWDFLCRNVETLSPTPRYLNARIVYLSTSVLPALVVSNSKSSIAELIAQNQPT